MSIINNLVSGGSNSIQKKAIRNIPISEIENNPLNKAPIIDLEDFAEVLKEEGIINPLIVYKVENGLYRLISGERRFTVARDILNLDTVPAVIIEKPVDDLEERLLILTSNNQREENEEYLKIKINEYGAIYDELKNTRKDLILGRKREWIEKKLGGAIKSRTIQKYLTGSDTKPLEKPQKNIVEELAKSFKKANKLFHNITIEKLKNSENLLKELSVEMGILKGNIEINEIKLNALLNDINN